MPPTASLSTRLKSWARARHDDMARREFARSLDVTFQKPLGQYGSYTLDPRLHIKATLIQMGRFPEVRTAVVHGGGRSTYYVWHEAGLRHLLSARRALLQQHGWPTEPLPFINHAMTHHAPIQTPLYDLVADTYGDKLNPGRTDVLPGVPRRELLEAYLDMHGHNDPAVTFWPFPNNDVPTPHKQPDGRYGVRDHGLDFVRPR